MAVLVEAISVVMRLAALQEKGFRPEIPNRTWCEDGHLARVGFMCPQDVNDYALHLEAGGLVYLRDGRAVDFVLADHLAGLCEPCDWAEFRRIPLEAGGPRRVAACSLAGAPETPLATPRGWRYELSLSRSCGFTPAGRGEESVEFLRHENGVDVYYNALTGGEVYIGRTGRTAAVTPGGEAR